MTVLRAERVGIGPSKSVTPQPSTTSTSPSNESGRLPLQKEKLPDVDEFESFEGCRRTRPVPIATVIETESRVQIAAITAPIRPRGRLTKSRLAAIARGAERDGQRPDLSPEACRAALRRAAEPRPAASLVVLDTDQKTTYPGRNWTRPHFNRDKDSPAQIDGYTDRMMTLG